uniref:Uncharacterized protein n=1 Tax=Trichogramma kaykai TaxID=54128 RepID=A0ABD2X699_9HYME
MHISYRYYNAYTAIPHSVLPLWSRLEHSAYAAHCTLCIIRMQHVDFYAIYICPAAAAPELSQKTLANCFCIERAIRCSIRISCSSTSARVLHRRAATAAIRPLCAAVFAYNLFRMRARPFIMYDIMFRRLSQAAGPLIKLGIALIAAHQALVKLLPVRCFGARRPPRQRSGNSTECIPAEAGSVSLAGCAEFARCRLDRLVPTCACICVRCTHGGM